MKLLTALLLLVVSIKAANQPEVSECFKVHALLKMDQDHYWADWTNACPYTIDSVYVMIQFAGKSGAGEGVWGLHFVTPGTHRVIRFSAPSSVPDFDSVHVRKITTDSAEALHADPTPTPARLTVAALPAPSIETETPRPMLAVTDPAAFTTDHHQRGRELLHQGHLREAIEELSEAIRDQPDLALAYNARGFAHFLSRDYRQALTDLDEAIRLNPNYLNAYQIRSQSRKALGDHAGSAADTQKARALRSRT